MYIWIIHDHDYIPLNIFTFLMLPIWMGSYSDKNKNWPEPFPSLMQKFEKVRFTFLFINIFLVDFEIL